MKYISEFPLICICDNDADNLERIEAGKIFILYGITEQGIAQLTHKAEDKHENGDGNVFDFDCHYTTLVDLFTSIRG